MKKYIVGILSALIFSSSFSQASFSTTSSDSIIYDKIGHLPEIMKYFQVVDSLFHGKANGAMIIQGRPSKGASFYWVQVGVDTKERLTPEFNFYVYPDDLVVKFYDTVSDSIISLEDWRKQKER